MTLTPDQATAAAHGVLIACMFALLLEGVRLRNDPYAAQLAGSSPFVTLSAIGVGATFIVERAFYLGARLVRSSGLDLWQMHPAPELLATSLAMSVMLLTAAIKVATLPARSAAFSILAGLVVLASIAAIAFIQVM